MPPDPSDPWPNILAVLIFAVFLVCGLGYLIYRAALGNRMDARAQQREDAKWEAIASQTDATPMEIAWCRKNDLALTQEQLDAMRRFVREKGGRMEA